MRVSSPSLLWRNSLLNDVQGLVPVLSLAPRRITRPLYNTRTATFYRTRCEMTNSAAAAWRLRLVQRHMQNNSISTASSSSASPASSSSSASTTPQLTAQQRRIDFSVLSQLMPNEANTTSTSVWYVVATAALLSFHQEPAVGELWKYINSLNGDPTTRVAIARRIRECCLKASVLVGFPRVRVLPPIHVPLPRLRGKDLEEIGVF